MNLTTYVRLSKKVVQWYLNHPVVVVDVQCDQMPDIKSCPNVFKSCLNNFQTSFYIYWSFSKKPKSQQSFGAIIESDFLARTLKIAQSGHTEHNIFDGRFRRLLRQWYFPLPNKRVFSTSTDRFWYWIKLKLNRLRLNNSTKWSNENFNTDFQTFSTHTGH